MSARFRQIFASGLLTLGSVLGAACPAAAAEGPDNRYQLSTEAGYAERMSRDIEPFFQRTRQEGKFIGVRGTRIAYATFIHPQEKGAIVLVSGRTESYLKYKEMVYDLYRQGYSVYMHDHRGQGLSERLLDDREKGYVEQFGDYVEDLDIFVRSVVLSRPHQRLFLLTHSMGGGIGTLYIEKYPDVFRAAALSSPMHAPNARILSNADDGCKWFKSAEGLCKDCYAGLLPRPYKTKVYKGNDYSSSEVRFREFRDIYENNPDIRLGGPTRHWVAESCRASDQLIADAGKIRIPVLVLQAGEDTAVTPEAQNAFCKSLADQTGKTCLTGKPVRFEGAQHELFIEADRFRIPALNLILDFLEAN
jgi:lysophospholipase